MALPATAGLVCSSYTAAWGCSRPSTSVLTSYGFEIVRLLRVTSKEPTGKAVAKDWQVQGICCCDEALSSDTLEHGCMFYG